MPENKTNQADLIGLLITIVRWRKLIISCVLTATVSVAILAFILPQKFRSRAVIKAYESSGSGLGDLVAAKLGGLGSLAGFAKGIGDIPEEMFVSILKSRWMSEKVIEEFDLRAIYKIKKAPTEDVIKALEQHSRFDWDSEAGTLLLYVDDRNPQRAQKILTFYINELDLRNQELKSYNAKREKEFIGARLQEERLRLAALEDSMSSFQQTTGVLLPEEQMKATMTAIAALQAERLMAKTQIEINSQVRGPSNLESRFMQIKLASIDSSIQSLIRSRSLADENDFLLHLEDTPSQGMTYLRLMRDIEIQQLLTAFLLQQYEQSRIEEQRNTPTIMRVDPPSLATKRIWPKRGLMVVLAALAAFTFAFAYALITEFMRDARSNPEHPSFQRFQLLRSATAKRK